MPKPEEIGRLEKVAVREVLPHEAAHFTPWLAIKENMEPLSAVIGLLGQDLSQMIVVGGAVLVLNDQASLNAHWSDQSDWARQHDWYSTTAPAFMDKIVEILEPFIHAIEVDHQ